jgi:hypothetical protein
VANLKISKGQPEAVNRRSVRMRRKKGQTVIYKTIHRKLKIEQHEPTLKTGGELGCF